MAGRRENYWQAGQRVNARFLRARDAAPVEKLLSPAALLPPAFPTREKQMPTSNAQGISAASHPVLPATMNRVIEMR